MITKSIKGQVWIETVIYTLIGLILIAIVLAYATPKINESRDNLLIEQSINAMQLFGEKIDETTAAGVGTRSIISLTIKKGELLIPKSSVENSTLDLRLSGLKKLYSEPGQEIKLDRVSVISREEAKSNGVSIIVRNSYPVYFCATDTGLIADCTTESKKFAAASIPYKFSIEKALINESAPEQGIKINIREAS
ncbi:MAG: hypothetical protein Q8Q31_01675 [Nanoarchaeota archaeon]|nr:hypothetical protein [Nanoarchaeota archaeon]